MFNKKQFLFSFGKFGTLMLECGILFVLFIPFVLFGKAVNDSKLLNASCLQLPSHAVVQLQGTRGQPAEPNWTERKSYWQAKFKDSFSPPKVGERGKIKLVNGKIKCGEIAGLTNRILKFRINNKVVIGYLANQLAPISRVTFFESDFIKYNVNLKINKEKTNYYQKLTEFQNKQKGNKKCNKTRQKIKNQNSNNNADFFLKKWSWRNAGWSVITNGQVKNISGHKIRNIKITISFYSANDRLITACIARVGKYDFILPNQVFSFTARAKWDFAMSKASISFKTSSDKELVYIGGNKFNKSKKISNSAPILSFGRKTKCIIINGVSVFLSDIKKDYIKNKSMLKRLTVQRSRKYLLVYVSIRNARDGQTIYFKNIWKHTKLFDNFGNIRKAKSFKSAGIVKLRPGKSLREIIVFDLPSVAASSFIIESDPCFLKKIDEIHMEEFSHDFFKIKFNRNIIR